MKTLAYILTGGAAAVTVTALTVAVRLNHATPHPCINAGSSVTSADWNRNQAAVPVPRVEQRNSAGLPSAAEISPETAALGLLNAVITGDESELAFFRRKLLSAGAQSVDHLEFFLNCGITELELETLRILLQTGSGKSLAMAISRMFALDFSSDVAARYLAVFAECRAMPVISFLMANLRPDSPEELRHKSVLLLASLSGPTLISAASSLLSETEPDKAVPDGLFELIGGRNNPGEAEALIFLFNSTPRADLKKAAALSLARIGTPRAASFLVRTSIEGSSIESGIALDAIRSIKSTHSQQTLIDTATDSRTPAATKLAAVSVLYGQNSPHARTALLNSGIQLSPDAVQPGPEGEPHNQDEQHKTAFIADIVAEENELCF